MDAAPHSIHTMPPRCVDVQVLQVGGQVGRRLCSQSTLLTDGTQQDGLHDVRERDALRHAPNSEGRAGRLTRTPEADLAR